ncbi:thiol reductant ABC exporter CydC subunit [Aeromicrobium panaciterrae]|uniref:Thiol reductant ABC exporter CydC subunit n=1 Tax=Aeromicrobium panaciterrae TaxID=363861 RepID=A0ABU1UJ41_9ACTN|nr:thiol reductant ABC exporter subunit CydC [Aeromicrobium panaciterrae]MDR7085206.1 thiol reductant ABC exporter CydC subunit [Aeromicrobium panaciterrae]
MNRRLVAGAVLGSASQLSSVGLLLTSAWLIVRAAEHPPVLYLMVAIVSVRFFGVGRAVFRYAERLLTHHVALSRMIDDRVHAYQNLERSAPTGLPRQRRGDIISRVVSDVTTSQDALLRIRLPWIYAITSCVVVTAVVAWISPVAALVIVGHALACFTIARLGIATAVRGDSIDASKARSTMSAESAVLASTSRDLVAYGAAAPFTRRLHEAIDRQARNQLRTGWLAGIGSALVLVSTGAATATIAFAAGGFAPVMAGVVLLAPVALLEPLLSVLEAERLRPAVQAARQRLAQLDDLQAPVIDPPAAVPLPISNELVLRGVVAGWDSSLTRPVSVKLTSGHIVGLSGVSGVGKSTLALTLVKLIPPRWGSLALGGIDYRDLDGHDVRARVGLCGQDDVLFDTTIRENLRVAAPDADDDAMQSVLTRVGLRPLLERMPAGLDTVIGNLGSSLSGGERQRLSMARLLLGQHKVLIFDEPTEHLDREAAAQMIADILSLRRGHAIVLISHSAEVLNACDEVVSVVSPFDPSPTTDHPGEPVLTAAAQRS